MSNRLLNRRGARELTPKEVAEAKGAGTGCFSTQTYPGGPIDDFGCDPDFPPPNTFVPPIL